MPTDTVTDRSVHGRDGDRTILRRNHVPLLAAHDAGTFQRRLRGLHGIPPLGPTDALIIRPCKAIHTFGLSVCIDVAFMDRYGVIVKLASVAPRRVLLCRHASAVVEMAEGTARRIGLCVGQQFVPDTGGWK